jgi:hypothetical protein
MKRPLTTAAVLCLGLIALGACGDEKVRLEPFAAPSRASCGAYASCSACTPVVGCGWCDNADGTGTCATSPDACAGAAFSWTWDPSGCRVPAEAGVLPVDAAANPTDARPPRGDAELDTADGEAGANVDAMTSSDSGVAR